MRSNWTPQSTCAGGRLRRELGLPVLGGGAIFEPTRCGASGTVSPWRAPSAREQVCACGPHFRRVGRGRGFPYSRRARRWTRDPRREGTHLDLALRVEGGGPALRSLLRWGPTLRARESAPRGSGLYPGRGPGHACVTYSVHAWLVGKAKRVKRRGPVVMPNLGWTSYASPRGAGSFEGPAPRDRVISRASVRGLPCRSVTGWASRAAPWQCSASTLAGRHGHARRGVGGQAWGGQWFRTLARMNVPCVSRLVPRPGG